MVVEEQKSSIIVKHESTSMGEIQKNIGRTIKSALLQAQFDSRVIIGITECINVLSKIPEGSLFCILAEPQAGDSATHMHEVLLEAFCYENDIYVIKVDSAEKLSRILGITSIVSCVLIQKSSLTKTTLSSSSSSSSSSTTTAMTQKTSNDHYQYEDHLNKMENAMVDHCEAYWDEPIQPIIKLPSIV